LRKLFVFIVAGLATLAAALPANSATRSKPVSYKSSARSADAFWYKTKWLSPTEYRQSVWYIGVYESTDGTFSDAYKTVVDCEQETGEDYGECTIVSSTYGYTDAPDFTLAKKLASAHLEATYTMNSYTEDGSRSGRSFTIDVVVDWNGTGDLQRNHGTSNYRDGCYTFHDSSRGAWRASTATGSVNARALGSTDDASLSKYSSRYLEKIC
jgi:hypothetical protein